MDGVLLQSKVWMGYAKSAQRVGLDFDVYRPTSAANPIVTGTKIATVKAAFTVHSSSDFNFSKPSDYKGPLFHALVDGNQVRVGDYLKSAATVDGPYFIASMDPIVPILAVNTNRIVTVLRPGGAAKSIGLSGYGGTVASTGDANELALMTAWPASVLEGARGVGGGELPADAGAGMWRVLMPSWSGVLITPGSVIADDIGRRLIVRQAELTDLGWNIQAVQALV
jgi:hypothetical protein